MVRYRCVASLIPQGWVSERLYPVTRVLLAANVAIPGATLGLALDLERLAAPRKLHNDTYTRRLRLIYDVTLCFLVPICYIALRASSAVSE